MEEHVTFIALSAYTIAALCLWFFEPVARHVGLVDHPNHRKRHETPTPLVGGIAMFVAFAFSILLLELPLSQFRELFAATILLVVIGVLDDLHDISARSRFAAEIIAALLMIFGGGIYLTDLGHLVSEDTLVTLGILSIPVTVFATVGVINALNMVDGIDGLAGFLALIAITAFGLLAWFNGQLVIFAVLGICAAVILAFLSFNFRFHGKALVYMGDAGSMFLGFIIAWFAIQLSQGNNRAMAPVTALWIFAIPLFDTVTVMLRRIWKGRSPFGADHSHCHYLLMQSGLSAQITLMVIGGTAMLIAAIGVVGQVLGLPEPLLFWVLLILFAIYFNLMVWLENRVNQPRYAEATNS